VGVLAGDSGAGGAQLVSKTINIRSMQKWAVMPFQKSTGLPRLLLRKINIASPFKSTLFVIKSISHPSHNAETDIKTDMAYR
jgi:hypothetical protein